MSGGGRDAALTANAATPLIQPPGAQSQAYSTPNLQDANSVPLSSSTVRANYGSTGSKRGEFRETSGPLYARLYERWPGRNTFLFDGRLMLGANAGCLTLTTLCIITASALSAIYVCHFQRGWVATVFNWFFALIVLGALFITATVDPGILPRTPRGKPTPRPLRGEHKEADGAPLRFCDECNFFRPPRSKHCKFCDNCCMEFDHHCPWTGGCIGLRNYGYYLMFLMSTSVYAIFILTSATDVVLRPVRGLLKIPYPLTPSLWDALEFGIRQRTGAACMALFSLLVLISVLPLVVYHMQLISQGLTTNEQVRNRYQGRSPYQRPFCESLSRTFCMRLPPPRLQPRVWVDKDWNPVAPAEVLLPALYVKQLRNRTEQQQQQQQQRMRSRAAAAAAAAAGTSNAYDNGREEADSAGGYEAWLPEPPRHWTDVENDASPRADAWDYSESTSGNSLYGAGVGRGGGGRGSGHDFAVTGEDLSDGYSSAGNHSLP